MIKHQLLLGLALIVGVVIGYFAAPSNRSDAPSSPDSGYVPGKPIADAGDAATINALRARIRELEARLKGAPQAEEIAVSNALAKARAEEALRPFGGRGDPRRRLEELKKSDPARYAQITNRMAKFRERRLARQQAKAEFLASVNTSGWSSSAKNTHDELQVLMEKREEIEESLHQEDLTDDQRHQLMDEMRSTDRQLRELNQAERTNLMKEVAQTVGLSGEDATEFVETVKDVYEATEGNRGPMGPPPEGAPPAGGAVGGQAGGPPPMM